MPVPTCGSPFSSSDRITFFPGVSASSGRPLSKDVQTGNNRIEPDDRYGTLTYIMVVSKSGPVYHLSQLPRTRETSRFP